MTDLSGKDILVLGWSRGIDADFVRRFAAEGGDVAVSYFGYQEAAHALAAEAGSKATAPIATPSWRWCATALPSTCWW